MGSCWLVKQNMNAFYVFLLLSNVLLLTKGQDSNLSVSTKNGLVRGIAGATVDSQKPFYAYRGIPYALPPTGDLRFSAPVPARNWTGVYNATVDKNSCIQDVVKGSEDCLYLSVYTPSIDPTNLLPVMVWIHGGFFLEGDSKYEHFGPDYFLEEDVVVVTLNYRLGVFGFLSTGDMSAPGNWGTKDQALALAWVQENIENFGGDKTKVTIFGESAGSASVSYLVQSSLAKNHFRGAIMESGTSLNLWALSRNPKATAFSLGRALGILTTSSSNLIKKLREVDATRLHGVANAIDLGQTTLTNPRNGLIFAPCEEPQHPDAVAVGKSHENLQSGAFNKVPMIVGFNSQEGIPFGKVLDRVRVYLSTYDLAPDRLVPVDMNVKPWNVPIVAIKIKSHYFGLTPVAFSNDRLVQYITDDQFARPINEAVRVMSKYAKVYYYRFSYMGNLGLVAGQPPRTEQGVGHGEDLNYLWRKIDNIRNPSQSDLLTRRRLIKLWTNFAKTLNPTPEEDPLLQNVTWIPSNPESQHYLDIGTKLAMGSNLSVYSIDWWRQLYTDYGNPPYDTY